PAEDGDDRGDEGDEHRVVEPRPEHRLPEQVHEVLVRRVEGPERRVVRRAPRPVQLGVRPKGRDEHPVEGEQRADHEHRERDVEEDPLLPQGAFDHARPGARASGHQAPSTRRMYQSWMTTITNRMGNMARDAAAPSPRSPVVMATWYA